MLAGTAVGSAVPSAAWGDVAITVAQWPARRSRTERPVQDSSYSAFDQSIKMAACDEVSHPRETRLATPA